MNSKYKDRLKILPNIDKLRSNKIVFVQNIQDDHHYKEHFLPFASQLLHKSPSELTEGLYNTEEANFSFWVYTHPDGHMAETKEMALKIMDTLDL